MHGRTGRNETVQLPGQGGAETDEPLYNLSHWNHV